MKAILYRTYLKDRTFGTLIITNTEGEHVFTCNTLELPNLDNLRQKSCIPEGEYVVTRHNSPSKGDCYKIQNVPNRDEILIHIGNFLKDTLGCVLVGTFQSNFLSNSRNTLEKLKKVAAKGFSLRIIS